MARSKKEKDLDLVDSPVVTGSQGIVLTIFLTILSVLFLVPIIVVFINSFKSKLYISDQPFKFPNADTFVGLRNYTDGAVKIGIFQSMGWSLFITVSSVIVIVFLTAMTAWALP
mgnify:CR=1 FL=1